MSAKFDVVNVKTNKCIWHCDSLQDAIDYITGLLYDFDYEGVLVQSSGITKTLTSQYYYGDFKIFESGSHSFEQWLEDTDGRKAFKVAATNDDVFEALSPYGIPRYLVDMKAAYEDKIKQLGYLSAEDIKAFISSDIDRRCDLVYRNYEKEKTGFDSDPLMSIMSNDSLTEEQIVQIITAYHSKLSKSAADEVIDERAQNKSKGTSYNVVNTRTGWVVKRDVTEGEGRDFIIKAYFDFAISSAGHPLLDNARDVLAKTNSFRDLALRPMIVPLPTHDLPAVEVLQKFAALMRMDSEVLATVDLTRSAVRKNPERAKILERPISLGFTSKKTAIYFLQVYMHDFGEFLYYYKKQNKPSGLNMDQTVADAIINRFLNSAELMDGICYFDIIDTVKVETVVRGKLRSEATDWVIQQFYNNPNAPEARAAVKELTNSGVYRNYRIIKSDNNTTPGSEVDISTITPVVDDTGFQSLEDADTAIESANIEQSETNGYLSTLEILQLSVAANHIVPESKACIYLIQRELRTNYPDAKTGNELRTLLNLLRIDTGNGIASGYDAFFAKLPSDILYVLNHTNNNTYFKNLNIREYLDMCVNTLFNGTDSFIDGWDREFYNQCITDEAKALDIEGALAKLNGVTVKHSEQPTVEEMKQASKVEEPPQVSEHASTNSEQSVPAEEFDSSGAMQKVIDINTFYEVFNNYAMMGVLFEPGDFPTWKLNIIGDDRREPSWNELYQQAKDLPEFAGKSEDELLKEALEHVNYFQDA